MKALKISSLLLVFISAGAISCASDQSGSRVSGVKTQESATADIAGIRSLAVLDFFEAKPANLP